MENLIGPELKSTEKLTRDKMLMKKKARKSQKLIMLNNLKHLLPPSKIRMIKLMNLLPPLKKLHGKKSIGIKGYFNV